MTRLAAQPTARDRLGSDVHVWVRPVERDAGAWGLDADESARAARFVRTEDRDSYVTAHRLLRAALSWARPDVPCRGWEFGVEEHDRPRLTGPVGDLRFSLSHSSRQVAVAVSRHECGVDVECGERVRDLDLIARAVLTRRELATLRGGRTAADRRRYFFGLWTLKESYTKARGLGMRLPFDRLEFTIDPITLIDRTVSARPTTEWGFAQWWQADVPVAVAFRREVGITEPTVFRHGRAGDSTEHPAHEYRGANA
ncbi:Phosphopantetheinyl transferase [Jatrophihabitans endophyticus]|uniref:Phosphopantetheinyl transferase n=1 Tax=Jatrophihabitans endophyticus TaxID=1206085 RepID=A0A1M5I411_9ACTN|nr:4'-phosphopantetheinyl transferase superfamily protein [Jatrophihabitans endophyticus]SHG23045.1 Phosphopantetheinyl transferase [Jatrophihabitans endophyticus]